MFENLQEKLQRTFKSLRGQAVLNEDNIQESLREWGADIAVGSRVLQDPSVSRQVRTHRMLSGHVFNFLVRRLGVVDVVDTQCGFKLLRGAVAEALFPRLGTDGFGFDVELLLLAQRRGYRIVEVPVNWADQPGSKVGVLRDGPRMLREVLTARRRLARLLGAPYFPVTPTFPLLGPLGFVPLPSKWRIEFCDPIDVSHLGPEAAEDRRPLEQLLDQARRAAAQADFERREADGALFDPAVDDFETMMAAHAAFHAMSATAASARRRPTTRRRSFAGRTFTSSWRRPWTPARTLPTCSKQLYRSRARCAALGSTRSR